MKELEKTRLLICPDFSAQVKYLKLSVQFFLAFHFFLATEKIKKQSTNNLVKEECQTNHSGLRETEEREFLPSSPFARMDRTSSSEVERGDDQQVVLLGFFCETIRGRRRD
jgi:hypothetical protein